MLTLCIRGDSMIELLKKYKVIIFFLVLVIINISWYIIKDSKEKDLSVDLGNQNNETSAWKQDMAQDIAPEQEQILDNKTQEATTAQLGKQTELIANQEVPVYICGEIVNPGVYYVDSKAIINDVVQKSGGLTVEADPSYLNLASAVQPNQKIYVPKIGEEMDNYSNIYENKEIIPSLNGKIGETQVNTKGYPQLININTATEEELQTLSGIGEVKAKAIVAYRSTSQGFKTIEELLNVSGIGDKTFEKIKALITI